ncbi:MAG TPA: HAD family phosphatase [Pyrinomonadaceae bacterium]|nr:HAD family phosphatase [Pyrinomonadaceae bacterium]
MIEAIFFDFNGVIIDDEPLHLKAYQEALAEEGITLTEAEYMTMLGMDDVTFVRTSFERAGKPLPDGDGNRVIAREWELHRKMIEEDLPLAPGVVTFIKAAARRYQLGIVSMSTRYGIDYVFERTRLGPAFAVVVSAEDVRGTHKPDPTCYKRALELLNEKRREERRLPLLPGECLVIEDSPPGIEAGRAAGMRTLGVTNTVPEEALRAARADVVTTSLADWTVDAVHHVFSEG